MKTPYVLCMELLLILPPVPFLYAYLYCILFWVFLVEYFFPVFFLSPHPVTDFCEVVLQFFALNSSFHIFSSIIIRAEFVLCCLSSSFNSHYFAFIIVTSLLNAKLSQGLCLSAGRNQRAK